MVKFRFARHFTIMCWKDFMVFRYHWIRTTLGVLAPITLTLLLVLFVRSKFKKMVSDKDRNDGGMSYEIRPVHYAPTDNFTTDLMECVSGDIGAEVYPEDNEDGVGAAIEENEDHYGVLLKFQGNTLNYSIRCTEDYPLGKVNTDPAGAKPLYYTTSFLAIQWSVAKCFTEKISNKSVDEQVLFKNFPSPPRIKSALYNWVKVLPVLLSHTPLILNVCLLLQLMDEKLASTRLLYTLCGISPVIRWIAWITCILIFDLMFIIPIVFLLHFQFIKTDVFLVFFHLLICCANAASVACIVSSMFRSKCLAAVFLIGLSFGTDVLFATVVEHHNNVSTMSRPVAVIVCILPNMAFMGGMKLMIYFEFKYHPMTFSAITQEPFRGTLNLLELWGIASLITIALLVIAMYLEYIVPDTVTEELCRRRESKHHVRKGVDNMAIFKPITKAFHTFIEISHVHKEFKVGSSLRVAIRDMTLHIFKGKITSFLGHRGSGRSTTMYLLAGLYSPTEGTIKIKGKDIETHRTNVTDMLGFCTEDRITIPDLSVGDHLLFVTMIKGCRRRSSVHEIAHALEVFRLNGVVNDTPNDLVLPFRVRLCVALAFVGKSELVILENPTQNLDTDNCHDIWDMILTYHKKQTILVSTGSMEEAQILGEFIVIMTDGSVQSYGSPSFLKRHYGAGYLLTIGTSTTQHHDKIIKLVYDTIPSAEHKLTLKTSILFLVALQYTTAFAHLLHELQRNKDVLGIKNNCIDVTNIGEILVGEKEANIDRKTILADVAEKSTEPVTGCKLFCQQVYAVMKKESLYTIRNWRTVLCKVCIQLLTVVALILLWTAVVKVPQKSTIISLLLRDSGETQVLYVLKGDTGKGFDHYFSIAIRNEKGQLVRKETVKDMRKKLIIESKKEINDFAKNYVLAFDMKDKQFSIWCSHAWYHSAPMGMNIIANAILMTKTQSETYSIMAENVPIVPEKLRKQFMYTTTTSLFRNSTGIEILLVLALALTLILWLCIFADLHIEEYRGGYKHLQCMAGCSPLLYWGLRWAWHMLALHLPLITLLTVAIYFCDLTHALLHDLHELYFLFLFFVYYGLSGIPFTYFASFFATRRCYEVMMNIYFLEMIYLLARNLDLSEIIQDLQKYYQMLMDTIEYLLFLLPNYSLMSALCYLVMMLKVNHECELQHKKDLDRICQYNSTYRCCSCSGRACYTHKNLYEEHRLMLPLVYLLATTPLYWALTALLESGALARMRECWVASHAAEEMTRGTHPAEQSSDYSHSSESLDSDVQREEDEAGRVVERVEQAQLSLERRKQQKQPQPTADVEARTSVVHGPPVSEETAGNPVPDPPAMAGLVTYQLVKKHLNSWVEVDLVSLRVRPGEGLLLTGPRNSGKSQVVRMLAGDSLPTLGISIANGYRQKSERKQYLKQLGYCPNRNSLVDRFTIRELAVILALIRGVPCKEAGNHCEHWISLLGLEEEEKQLCVTYTVGQRRRASAALALVGDPPVLLLDDPTRDIDFQSRRLIWRALAAMRENGRAVLASTTSLTEGASLADRQAVLLEGQLQAIGGPAWVRSKFQRTTGVNIKLRSRDMESEEVANLRAEMARSFGAQCVLVAVHKGMLRYRTAHSIRWPRLFRKMERIKASYEIVEDYRVAEPAMQQALVKVTV